MKVVVNGLDVELPTGSRVMDAIRVSGAVYHTGCVIGLVEDTSKSEVETDRYMIETSRGKLKIRLRSSSGLTEYWKKNYREFVGKQVVWQTKNALAFGHISTDLVPRRSSQNYRCWDIFLGLSGFESDKTDLIFSTSDHTGTYGEPEDGIFARLIGGRETIQHLKVDDTIDDVRPLFERGREVVSKPISPDAVLKGGEKIVTYLEFDMEMGEEAYDSVEYALTVLENETATVTNTAHAFAQLAGIMDMPIEPENTLTRRRGVVTVRNRGINMGDLYVYRDTHLPVGSHNVVGRIVHGIELADIAESGQCITVKTIPERVMVIGLTQREAEKRLEERGIRQVREGLKDDDAIVVSQEPINTPAILKEMKLSTIGARSDEVVKIELYYEKAPKTVQYFKFICGLLDKPIGKMRVFNTYEDLGMTLFKPDASLFNRAISIENTPIEKVVAFEIGVTNMSRKNLGMIGIRDHDDTNHGPTGEEFASTNIVGRITDGFEILKRSKRDQIIYLQVTNRPETQKKPILHASSPARDRTDQQA